MRQAADLWTGPSLRATTIPGALAASRPSLKGGDGRVKGHTTRVRRWPPPTEPRVDPRRFRGPAPELARSHAPIGPECNVLSQSRRAAARLPMGARQAGLGKARARGLCARPRPPPGGCGRPSSSRSARAERGRVLLLKSGRDPASRRCRRRAPLSGRAGTLPRPGSPAPRTCKQCREVGALCGRGTVLVRAQTLRTKGRRSI